MRSYGRNIVIVGDDLSAFPRDPSGFPLPPNPDTYESDVHGLLERINTHAAGERILAAISETVHTITIVPSPVLVDSAAVGLSRGSQAMDVGIPFSTSLVNESGFPVSLGAGAGGQPDEALFHELVHGLRFIAGGFYPAAMHEGFDNREEFYAILITNIYSSEEHRPLRRDHHGFHIWDPGGSDAQRFYEDHLEAIDALRQEGSGLGLAVFLALSRIGTPFNPVRQYIEDEARLRGITPEAWARGEIREPVFALPGRSAAPNPVAERRFMFNF